VLSNHQFPTLWDPQELFLHLAVWAGVPAILMAVVAALLGIYKSVRSWVGFGKSTARAAVVAGRKLKSWTPPQQQAMVRFLVFSALAVALSYMLAVIIDAAVRLIAANPNKIFSIKDVVDHVSVTPWPPAAVWTVVGEIFGIGVLGIACIANLEGVQQLVTALGSVVWIAAWLAGIFLVADAILMCLGLLLEIHNPHPAAPVPVPFLVTCAVTGLVALVLAQLLPRVYTASADAFAPSSASSW
jgi:hypothetical protein